MNLGIVIPHDLHFSIIQEILMKEFPNIHSTFLYYHDYKETASLLKGQQSRLDGLLFSGSSPYDYAAHYLHREIPWDFLDRYSGSLLRAMLEASLKGYDLTNISYDYYDFHSIQDIYKEQNIQSADILFLSYKYMIETGKNIENYNEEIYKFHKDNWLNKKASCCITPCYLAMKWLQSDHIPVIFAYPTADVCRETIRRIHAAYTAKINQGGQIVIISVEIDLPNEYSMFACNERLYIQDKNRISSYIYNFSDQLDATVVEVTYRNYLIFTTRSIFETATNNLESFDLLARISEHYLSFVSIGIGYGKTVKDAKENANLGLMRAKKFPQNAAFIVYADKIPRGPVGEDIHMMPDKKSTVNREIMKISSQSGVSMQNIEKIYDILTTGGKDTFTTADLAQAMSVTRRSIDRIVNKLESAGYAEIVGKQTAYQIGRPRRVVKIHFNLCSS